MISKKLHYLVMLFLVLLFNVVIYGPFLRLDITAEQPWRQTDSQAEITAYANGTTSFFKPVVNAPRTQWGPGVIEIGFPVFQYTAGILTRLITPITTSFLKSDQQGMVKLPYGFKLADYQQSKVEKDNKVIYTVSFALHHTYEYALAVHQAPYIKDYVHLYLIAHQVPSQKTCVDLTLNGNSNKNTPKQYCYGAGTVPIVYIPISDSKNTFQFTFNKLNAPKNLESTFSLFPISKYASPELLAGRIINIITVALFSIFMACAFFPRGWFRVFAAIAFSAIPIFGVFATFIHEEIQAILCVSIFLWIIFKRELTPGWVILAAIFLSIAVAIRPYYILYSLVLAGFAFYKEKMRIFSRPAYYIAALITLLPAVLWYSWTQYMVAHGADTIDIFSDRVLFSSLLSLDKWKGFSQFFVHFHFGVAILSLFILIYIAFIWLLCLKRIKANPKLDIFLGVGLCINLIIFTLVFDSASIHDYYCVPVTAYMSFAALICFYRIYELIKSVKWRKILSFVVFAIIIISGVNVTYARFAQNVRGVYDPLDYAVLGNLAGELFQPNDKAILLDAGGPQAYGMSNRYGRRDTGFYSGFPFKGVDDLKQYFRKYYGPINTYAGIGSCYTLLHRVETFPIYNAFVKEQQDKEKSIVYVLTTYPRCQFIVFPDKQHKISQQ